MRRRARKPFAGTVDGHDVRAGRHQKTRRELTDGAHAEHRDALTRHIAEPPHAVQRRCRERKQRRVRERDAVQRNRLRGALDRARRLAAEGRRNVGIAHAAADEHFVADAQIMNVGTDAHDRAGGLITGHQRIAQMRHAGQLAVEEQPFGAARDR